MDGSSLPKRDANFVPLSPITFLPRAASAYADRTSIVYGSISFTWRQTYQRCCRLAAAIQQLAVSRNDVVSDLMTSAYFIITTYMPVRRTGSRIFAHVYGDAEMVMLLCCNYMFSSSKLVELENK